MPPFNAIDWAIEHARLQGEAAADARRNWNKGSEEEESATAFLLLAASGGAYESGETTERPRPHLK